MSFGEMVMILDFSFFEKIFSFETMEYILFFELYLQITVVFDCYSIVNLVILVMEVLLI